MEESQVGLTLSPLEDHLAAPRGRGRLADAPHFGTAGGAACGGVDSAGAPELARRGADEVVAVTLELWSDPENDGSRSCCSPQAVVGARALAHRMGLPHVTVDLRQPFRQHVVDHFLAEHAAGATPNPCTRCNGLVRFDAMLD